MGQNYQFPQLSTLHNNSDNYPIFFNDTPLAFSSTLNKVGFSFIKNLNWLFHISTPDKSASKKLSVLWRMRQFFSPSQRLALYRDLICPCMEYDSHIWGGSTHTALLNKVESKAFRLINSPSLADCLDSLSHRRNVASLSLFYFNFHAECSSELANCMPLPRPRCTRLYTSSHPCYVYISNARVNQYLHSFMPYTGKL